MSDWQPIETAPKDWTEILCVDCLSVGNVYYLAFWDGNQWRDEIGPVSFHYWMPLPVPPEAA